jgi:hypothetical protein
MHRKKPVRNVSIRPKSRFTAHSVCSNAPLSSLSHSLRTHLGTPNTRSVRSHPGTPDTDVTVPLPAKYVAEQATIIRQQISSPLDGCPPGFVGKDVLLEEIFRMQNWLIHLRGNLGKEHITRRRVTKLCRKKLSSSPTSNQVTSSAVQDALEEMDRKRLDIHNLKVELSRYLKY